MNDINLIRKEPGKAREAIKDRGGRYLPVLETLIEADAQYRELLQQVEALRARRNSASQAVGKAKAGKDDAEASRLMAEVAQIKADMAGKDEALGGLGARVRQTALGLPNFPHPSVPKGKSADDNPVVRTGAAVKPLGFKPQDHQTFGEKLGLLDSAAAAKLSGSRFSLWRGAGARLMRAIISFLLDLHTGEHGYQEMWVPALVRPDILEGTGQLPKFEADLYKIAATEGEKTETLFLIPTAEVPLTNLVRDQIIPEADLPMRLTAYTPCFRQEAGSYGKDVRGLIRNHQFDKVELVWVTKPEESLAALESLTGHAEAVLKRLELPFRVVELCTADLGFSAAKTYDLEVWMAGEGQYREISSCSNCGDFQARRMNARVRRSGQGGVEFVHTLNGSGVAVGRLFAAILENYQQPDGSLVIPKALVPYFGAERIAAPKA
ncbi:MAG TPA: serine--tRNA ligase [Elusimicrobia bacterium]|nr:serine--tRNA ligase [Elusimicrobiota bacterium]HBT61850.1 serine--tRNA ligase [Elusimicrobiota bacterium]